MVPIQHVELELTLGPRVARCISKCSNVVFPSEQYREGGLDLSLSLGLPCIPDAAAAAPDKSKIVDDAELKQNSTGGGTSTVYVTADDQCPRVTNPDDHHSELSIAKGKEGLKKGKAQMMMIRKRCFFNPKVLHYPDYSGCSCMVKPINTRRGPSSNNTGGQSSSVGSNADATAGPSSSRKRKDMNQEEAVKKRKKVTTRKGGGPMEIPVLPEDFRGRIRELRPTTDPVLVIQKTLFATDVNPNHVRLSMPVSIVTKFLAGRTGFLTDVEKAQLEELSHAERNNTGMKVDLIDTKLVTREITLKQWNMEKPRSKKKQNNPIYALSTTWKKLVADLGLKEGNTVQVWSFRAGSALMLALVLVDQGCADDDPEKSSEQQNLTTN